MKYTGMIMVDLDGTLLKPDYTTSEEDRQALLQAKKQGNLIVLCTGRSAYMIIKRFTEFQLDGIIDIIIGCNGSQYYDTTKGGEVEILGYIPKAAVAEVLALTDNREYGIAWYGEHEFYTNEANKLIADISAQLQIPAVIYRNDEILEHFPEKWPKAVMFLNNLEQRSLRDVIEANKTVAFDTVFSSPLLLELLPRDVNKGSAFEILCARFGIDPQNTMAIGDEDNDVPMLKKSKFGVAMANGTELVKASADYITGSLQEHGLSQAVYRFLDHSI